MGVAIGSELTANLKAILEAARYFGGEEVIEL